MRTRCPIPLLFVTTLLVFNNLAYAGAPHVDCREPIVFPGAAVNLVVLPYRYTGVTQLALGDTGKRLSLLVKLDSLLNMLPYGSVGAVQMELPERVRPDDPSCQPDIVMGKLLSNGGTGIRSGHGLVLVWGLIYEEGDDLFVQTFTRFLRKDRKEEITLKIQGAAFSGRPSSQAVSFSPHKISRKDLDRIEDSFSRADYIRSQKSDQAPGERLLRPAKCTGPECEDPSVHSAYWVDRSEGEWMHVTLQNPASNLREGWIHARIGLEGQSLDGLLPELHFIRGVAGYLRQRAGEDGSTQPAPQATLNLALKEFSTFEASVDREEAELAVAVAKQLSGMMKIAVAPASDEAVVIAATKDFNEARALVPYSPEATNLAAVATISQDFRKPGSQDVASKEQELVEAATLSTGNGAALQNLKSFYGLVLRNDRYTGVSKQESQRRIEMLKRVENVPRARIPNLEPESTVTSRAQEEEGFKPSLHQDRAAIAVTPDRRISQPQPEIRRPVGIAAQPPQQTSTTSLAQSAGSAGPGSTPSRREAASITPDLVPAYNLPNISTPLRFTPDILGGIFAGQIRQWNDPVIASANAGVRLPATQILLIPPPAEAEIARALDGYLKANSQRWRRAVISPARRFPAELGATTGQVVSAIRSKPGSISVVPLNAADANHLAHGTVLR